MMKSPLEEYAPYRLLALFILIVFYGIYLAKAWIQKRCGIQTHQIGKRKEKSVHTVETVMGIATVSIIPVQLFSLSVSPVRTFRFLLFKKEPMYLYFYKHTGQFKFLFIDDSTSLQYQLSYPPQPLSRLPQNARVQKLHTFPAGMLR